MQNPNYTEKFTGPNTQIEQSQIPFDTALHEVLELLGKEHLPKRSVLEQYRPKLEWYLDKELAKGVHGISHEARVMILQELITSILIAANPQTEQSVNRTALRWAAACHDLRRVDDWEDVQHGNRAAKYTKEQLKGVIPDDIQGLVIDIILGHVPADNKIDPKKMTTELRIFKDSDGLDRVRIFDLNPKYLRLKVSSTYLVAIAQRLHDVSMDLMHKQSGTMDVDKQWNATMDAAIDIGILQP